MSYILFQVTRLQLINKTLILRMYDAAIESINNITGNQRICIETVMALGIRTQQIEKEKEAIMRRQCQW